MTEEKGKDNKKVKKQQQKKSETVKTVTQPKPEAKPEDDQPDLSVNLCDDCLYDPEDCEGVPVLAVNYNPELVPPEGDFVVKCEQFKDVNDIPAADEVEKKKTSIDVGGGSVGSEGDVKTEKEKPEDDQSEKKDRVHLCDTCIFECDIEEAESAREAIVEDGVVFSCPGYENEEDHSDIDQAVEDGILPEYIPANGPARPDPQRFNQDEEFGTCPSCNRKLKRTALNRYRDAVRCTNPRCQSYRNVVKTVSTGV